MAAKAPKKTDKKIQRKTKLRYPKVGIDMPDVFDEQVVLPGMQSMPNEIALAINTGQFHVLVKFLREQGFEQGADAFELLAGEDENREFFSTWSNASEIDLPKSAG